MKAKALSTRRGFFVGAGAAALSGPLAVAAAHAAQSAPEDAAGLEARLARLEDQNAIRAVHAAYARHLNAGARKELAALFADTAAATCDERIRNVSTDRLDEAAIEISPGGDTATARIRCTAQVESPIEPTCPLVEMARQQGGGVVKRTESGVFENAYVKRRGVWKIERVTYRSA